MLTTILKKIAKKFSGVYPRNEGKVEIMTKIFLEEEEARIFKILCPGEEIEGLEELPKANSLFLEKYKDYLKSNLPEKILMTGREDMGYFSWEEKYTWGGGSSKEHDCLKKEKGSFRDK